MQVYEAVKVIYVSHDLQFVLRIPVQLAHVASQLRHTVPALLNFFKSAQLQELPFWINKLESQERQFVGKGPLQVRHSALQD